MYKVEILQPAWEELERIADLHMALVGPRSAKKATDGILNCIEALKVSPFGFPRVHDEKLAEQGYRMTVYKKYLVIYRVLGETIYVYHIADGRSDYPQLMRY